MHKFYKIQLLLIILLLSGCYKSSTYHHISADGKVTTKMSILYDLSSDRPIATKQELQKEIEDYRENKTNKVTLLKETIDGKEYEGYEVLTIKPQDIDTLKKVRNDVVDYSEIQQSISIELDVSSLLDSIENTSNSSDRKSLKKQGVEMYTIFTIEGTITETNGNMTNDRRSVTFDMLELSDDTLIIKADLKQSRTIPYSYYIIGAFTLSFLCVGIVLLIKKRKKR